VVRAQAAHQGTASRCDGVGERGHHSPARIAIAATNVDLAEGVERRHARRDVRQRQLDVLRRHRPVKSCALPAAAAAPVLTRPRGRIRQEGAQFITPAASEVPLGVRVGASANGASGDVVGVSTAIVGRRRVGVGHFAGVLSGYWMAPAGVVISRGVLHFGAGAVLASIRSRLADFTRMCFLSQSNSVQFVHTDKLIGICLAHAEHQGGLFHADGRVDAQVIDGDGSATDGRAGGPAPSRQWSCCS